jgi:anti-anti-sigma factor
LFADHEQRLTAPVVSEARPEVRGGTPRVSASVADRAGHLIATVTRYREDPAPATGDALTVVEFTGDMDLDSAPLLERVLITAIDEREQVCCDLNGAAFVGAAGANTLLAAHRYAAQSGRRFSVRGASPMTRQILAITGIDQVLTVHD